MLFSRTPRTVLTLMSLNRVILNNSRLFGLVFNRPAASSSLTSLPLVWTSDRMRPSMRYLSTDGTTSSRDGPSSPLGKASSEMHGGAGENESREQKSSSSTPNEEEQSFEEPLEMAILKAAMKFVPELGFTDEAISRGVSECGLSPASKGIFQNGAFDLIDYFYKRCNSETAAYLENQIKEKKVIKKSELIRSAVLYRLTLIQPYISHWPKAMAIMSFYPTYALKSIENLMKLCDEIWFQAGDTSTDFNWYSKRLSLAAVYKSTELFMIQDKSENFKDTEQFLDNRFRDLAKVNEISNQVSVLAQLAGVSVTVLKNMLNIRN